MKALIAARKAFAPVTRSSTGQIGQSRTYTYADLTAVLESVLLPLLDHGLAVVQGVDAATATLVTRLVHTSGEWMQSTYPLKLDQPPQQLGSAITYARRYSILALLNLATEDDDGAAAQPAPRRPRAAGNTAPPAEPTGPSERSSEPPAAPRAHARTITTPQIKKLWATADAHGWQRADVRGWLIGAYSVPSSRAILQEHYDAIIRHLEQGPTTAAPSSSLDDVPF
jgi:hypothetical protein